MVHSHEFSVNIKGPVLSSVGNKFQIFYSKKCVFGTSMYNHLFEL